MNWHNGWCIAILAAACVTSARATQLSYEADVFPEQAGWTQSGNIEEPSLYSRSVSAGVFSINATASGGATVYYSRDLEISTDRVTYEWRARTSNDDGASIFAIYVKALPSWAEVVVSWGGSSGFAYMYKGFGPFDDPTEFLVTPGEYHVFEVDVDGSRYALSVDGVLRLQSELIPATGLTAKTKWGFSKYLQSVPTTGSFDYIRAYDLPEPCSAVLCGVSGLLLLIVRARRRT